MPGKTTPDNISYPVVGDPMTPLASWFALQAGNVQTALTAMRNEFSKPEIPEPLSSKGAPVQAVTATAWADLPNMDAITLSLPRPCWVTITFGAWMAATAGDVRASARVTGATTLSETQLEVGGDTSAWGQVLYSNNTTNTRQSTSIRTVRLNSGTNTIRGRAYRSGTTGVKQVNYSTLQVAPLRWA